MKKSRIIKSLLFTSVIILSLSSCATVDAIAEGTKIATDFIVDVTVSDDEKREAIKSAKNSTIDSGKEIVQGVPPETEYAIGRSAAAALLKQYELYDNPEATEYLNKICTTLVINSPKPYMYKGYFVAILDSDEINAISTPGGHIFISKGLLDCTNSEDAIAAVIAHELSHIQIGHSVQAIKGEDYADFATSAFSLVLASGGDDYTKNDIDQLNDTSDSWVRKVMRNGFSRDQEFEADANAIKLMEIAGYNPFALIDMLQAINVTSHNRGGWGDTHPNPEHRIKEALKVLKKGEYKKTDMSPRQERFNQFKRNF